ASQAVGTGNRRIAPRLRDQCQTQRRPSLAAGNRHAHQDHRRQTRLSGCVFLLTSISRENGNSAQALPHQQAGLKLSPFITAAVRTTPQPTQDNGGSAAVYSSAQGSADRIH